MERRTFLVSAALLPLAISLSGCDDRWKDYNYKMTVWIGDKPYSTVRHVKVEEGATIQSSSGRRVDRRAEGEAVIIETPSGPVFALMTPAEGEFGFGRYAARVADAALIPAIGKPQESEGRRAIREYREEQPRFDELADDAAKHNAMLEVKGPRDLPRTFPNPDPYRGPRDVVIWPMFIRFGDINNPETLQKVYSDSIGVSRITIEVTNDCAATGIENVLPWLDHLEKYRSDPRNVFTSILPEEISGLRIKPSK
jgi:hypothetical protein